MRRSAARIDRAEARLCRAAGDGVAGERDRRPVRAAARRRPGDLRRAALSDEQGHRLRLRWRPRPERADRDRRALGRTRRARSHRAVDPVRSRRGRHALGARLPAARLRERAGLPACRASRRRRSRRRSPSRSSAPIASSNGSPSPSTRSPTWTAAAAPRTRCCPARSSSGCFAKRWGRNRWRDLTRYIARLDGEPAGEAALHVDEGLALLAGSGTVPHLRGRGVQKALVARRLDDARREGCDLAVVVTAPGTRSQDNVMRRGFELLYTRAILMR